MPENKKHSALGLGNALMDILIPVKDDKILSEVNLPKGSMTLVDEDRARRILALTKDFNRQFAPGGSAANTIYGLAALGMPAGFIGSVGSDKLGKTFQQSMEDRNISMHLNYSSAATGHAITLITPDGERTFATFLGAASDLKRPQLDETNFALYTHIHIEGYLIIDPPLLLKALSLAKKAGLTVSYDLASYNVVENNREQTYDVLNDYVDIVFANEEEAEALTGKNAAMALDELSGICDVAVVKLGHKGSSAGHDSERYAVPASPANVVDTTGAGDLYAAGFIYGFTMGFTIEQSLKVGSLLGGKVIETAGSKIREDQWKTIYQQIEVILED